jgi:hypothetical protein
MDRDLYFFIDDNGSFLDATQDAREYLRDPVSHDYVAAEDFIYVGLYKPFRDMYFEIGTALIGNTLIAEYWDGSSWASLDIKDQTKSFARSGFISWQAPTDWAETTINTESLFYVRFSLSLDATLDITGANLVFANDVDLEKHQRDINMFLAKGDASFIAYHVSARDHIIQKLRNGGKRTRKENQEFWNNFTKWDVLDIDEVREAATHLALSKINFDIAENQDDKFYQKYLDHRGYYGSAFKLFSETYDLDDDGVIDLDSEKTRVRSVSIFKV